MLKAFRAHQGLLLAGALAYNALLSIVPMMILTVIALSHVIAPAELLATLARYLEWLLPGQSRAVVAELEHFVDHREVVGWVLLATMLFFSSLAFTVLENAMAIIFGHRAARRRHFAVSALLPYAFMMCLAAGALIVTLVAVRLEAVGERSLVVGAAAWSLEGMSGLLMYLVGFAGEVLVLAAIYLVMPVGRPRPSRALLGAVVAALLWEVSRHLLVWYFATLSQIGRVYGSLTTAIAVLLGLEVGGALLLLGAQVIAEFERLEGEKAAEKATDKAAEKARG